MDILKTAGQIAGVGGLAIGALILIFRDVIRKNIFPKLNQASAYRLLKLIVVAAWSTAVLGIAVWAYSDASQNSSGGDINQTSTGANSPNISNVKGGVTINSNPQNSK